MLVHIFGRFTGGLIRLAFTAATILLVYFFILKPILETTENVTGGLGGDGGVQKALDSVGEAFGGDGSNPVRRQIENQLSGINLGSNSAEARKARRLLDCVQNSTGDGARIRRCANRFAP